MTFTARVYWFITLLFTPLQSGQLLGDDMPKMYAQDWLDASSEQF